MIIKSFAAPTIAGALKLIRETLGGDAIVLKTKDCGRFNNIVNGNRFEVTACIDEALAKKPLNGIASVNNTVNSEKPVEAVPIKATIEQAEKKEKVIPNRGFDKEIESIRNSLINADIPRELVHDIVMEMLSDTTANDATDKALEILKSKLTRRIEMNLTVLPDSKIAFVGFTGAGKSSVMAKVAASLSMIPGNRVKLVALDQIGDDGKNSKSDFFENKDFTKQFKTLKTEPETTAITLIDTPAISVKADNNQLIDQLASVKPDIVFLVYSVTQRSVDLVNNLEKFKAIVPTYQIATHLDETERWGGIITMTENIDSPLAFVTDTPGGEGQLLTPDPDIIAERILKDEEGDSDAE